MRRVVPPRGPCAPAAIAFAALILGTASGCGEHGAATGRAAGEELAAVPLEIAVVEVRSEPWPRTVRVQGNLLGNDQSTVGAKLAGRVEKVSVDLGSVVRQGQTLAALETSDLELRVRQAEAQLVQACAAIGLNPDRSETDLDREQAPPVALERALRDEARASAGRGQQLRERGTITEAEFEALEAKREAAEARYRSALNAVGEQIASIGVRRVELALARQQLADARIVAPFDGIVEQRLVSPGEYVQVGDAVASLVRTDVLRFTAGVPERLAAQVRTGQAIAIHLDGEPRPLPATVSRLSPSVTPSGRALWIEADVPNRDLRLRTGLFAEAEIVIDASAHALVVPDGAVAEFAGIEKVWVVRGGEAQEQPIRAGRRGEGRIEVLDGLQPGDLIVAQSDQGRAGPVVAVRDAPAASPPGQAAETGVSE